jgi:hypothetical protein
MSLDDVLNSTVALPKPIPARLVNGTRIMLQHVGPVASFLLTEGAGARTAHPALWQKAEIDIVAADKHPADVKKGYAAWLSVFNLLSAANLLE